MGRDSQKTGQALKGDRARIENGAITGVPIRGLTLSLITIKNILMKYMYVLIVCMLLGTLTSHAENIIDLTARAIGESNPDVCLQAQEVCYESSWERSCLSKEVNQSICFRDYAIAKVDPKEKGTDPKKGQGNEAGCPIRGLTLSILGYLPPDEFEMNFFNKEQNKESSQLITI